MFVYPFHKCSIEPVLIIRITFGNKPTKKTRNQMTSSTEDPEKSRRTFISELRMNSAGTVHMLSSAPNDEDVLIVVLAVDDDDDDDDNKNK